DGSSLQNYFQSAGSGEPEMYVRLNQYAHTRFPHNLYFVRNLLVAYQSRPTRNQAAWEELLREHWFEATDLRNEFFEFLSSSGKLEAELHTLEQSASPRENAAWADVVQKNPAAG